MFGGHGPVRHFARRVKVGFSSDMGLRKMKRFITAKETGSVLIPRSKPSQT